MSVGKRSQLWILVVLSVLIVADLAYSFNQHYHRPLDGDMPNIISPSIWYAAVLTDPYGFQVITEGKHYAGPNRFYAHWSEYAYFRTVPLLLQAFTSPITSVYLAQALYKILLQLLIIWVIARMVSGASVTNPSFLLAALLMVPLIQVEGYYESIVFVLSSITYTIFYTTPLTLFALYLLPFHRSAVTGKPLRLKVWQHGALVLLSLIIPFHGPLMPPIIVLACGAALLISFVIAVRSRNDNEILTRIVKAIGSVPRSLLFHFSLIIVTSVYSYYLSLFNVENREGPGLAERYALLWQGFVEQVFGEPAYPMLFGILLLNVLLLRRDPESLRLRRMLATVFIVCLVYIMLLPLGGFRDYRPLLIRYDTFMPVAFASAYAFVATTHRVFIRSLQFRWWPIYGLTVATVLAVFTFADRFNDDVHWCERRALEQIAASPDRVVEIQSWCSVLEWRHITDTADSRNAAVLLKLWNITETEKRFTVVP